MPKIEKTVTLEITPERFLQACSPNELQEIDILIQSPRFRDRMASIPVIEVESIKPLLPISQATYQA